MPSAKFYKKCSGCGTPLTTMPTAKLHFKVCVGSTLIDIDQQEPLRPDIATFKADADVVVGESVKADAGNRSASKRARSALLRISKSIIPLRKSLLRSRNGRSQRRTGTSEGTTGTVEGPDAGGRPESRDKTDSSDV